MASSFFQKNHHTLALVSDCHFVGQSSSISLNWLFNSAVNVLGYVLGHLLCKYVIGTLPAVSCGYQDEAAEK